MEYKSAVSYIKSVTGNTVEGYTAVMGNVDSGGDRIFRGSFKKTIKENMDRVRHLWQHDWTQPPIAAVRELSEVQSTDLPQEMLDKSPEVTGALRVVREYLDTPRSNEVLTGIKSGAINEMSFGYDPIKFDFEEDEEKGRFGLVRNLRELRLWDTSDVNWGMNELTMANAKVVVPFKDTGKADEGAAWSKPTLGDFTDQTFDELSAGEKRRIASHYAWTASMPPESFGDLKLPHHQAAKSGVGPAVWNGVRSAMSVLMGGMGGVDLPEGDRRGVYNHLAKHYAQWDKEPPEFKTVQFSAAILVAKDVPLEQLLHIKEGRVLSARNIEKLKNALAVLEEILLAAEPPEEDSAKALTERVLRRLQLAAHDPILFME